MIYRHIKSFKLFYNLQYKLFFNHDKHNKYKLKVHK
jgi:hypothetical protein